MSEVNQNNNSQSRDVYQEATAVMNGVGYILGLFSGAITLLSGARYLINEFSK